METMIVKIILALFFSQLKLFGSLHHIFRCLCFLSSSLVGRAMTSYEHALQEPLLKEVMCDPIVLALMRYDAVEEEDISQLVEQFEE